MSHANAILTPKAGSGWPGASLMMGGRCAGQLNGSRYP